jgi:hypothetical protein
MTDRPIAVAVVGSRGYPRLDLVEKFIQALPPGTTLVSGGAPGVDTIAETAWKAMGGSVMSIKAEWQLLGNTAGIERNGMIVLESGRVYGFWDESSPGTANTICRAANAGSLRWIAGRDGHRDTERLLERTWAIESPKGRLTRAWERGQFTDRTSAAPPLPGSGSERILESASAHGAEVLKHVAAKSSVRT